MTPLSNTSNLPILPPFSTLVASLPVSEETPESQGDPSPVFPRLPGCEEILKNMASPINNPAPTTHLLSENCFSNAPVPNRLAPLNFSSSPSHRLPTVQHLFQANVGNTFPFPEDKINLPLRPQLYSNTMSSHRTPEPQSINNNITINVNINNEQNKKQISTKFIPFKVKNGIVERNENKPFQLTLKNFVKK